MGAGSNGIIFYDLERPLTRDSRSLYTYKWNISKTVRSRDKVTKEHYKFTVEIGHPLTKSQSCFLMVS